MGLLRRLIGNLHSRRAPAPAQSNSPMHQVPSVVNTNGAGNDFQVRCDLLASELRQLYESGKREAASALMMTKLPKPATMDEAQTLMRRVVLPVVENCAVHGDASVACELEPALHWRVVKVFEDPGHFEACMSMIDLTMRGLGQLHAPHVEPLGQRGATNLLFFCHNMHDDLAHSLLLCDLVDAYLAAHPDEAHSIGLVGVYGSVLSPAFRALQERWQVSAHRLQGRDTLQAQLQQVAQLIASGEYDRVIVVSVPIAISYLTGLLPPSRVGWLSMKYQLSCFEHLRHRCSFRSGLRREQLVDGRVWLQAAPLFNGNVSMKPMTVVPPVMQEARRFATVLYTINREEKVRNPQFLERVARILERVDDSVFVWTGRKRLPEIDAFFTSRGLQNRHLFAGWVTPDDLLQTGDLFLDTPVLSGNVAAQATALGVPVLTDAAAITWVGTFLPAYLASRGSAAVAHLDALIDPLQAQGILLQCTGDDQYVQQAVRLAQDPPMRRRFGQALEAFARHYFFEAGRSATDHFINLRAPVAD